MAGQPGVRVHRGDKHGAAAGRAQVVKRGAESEERAGQVDRELTVPRGAGGLVGRGEVVRERVADQQVHGPEGMRGLA